ncbi:MAG: hypothetical protein P8Q36_09480 [Alphaproteobacteria bacterium]|nr:hypothetical protein [Alphaproteobacteria bacterium]
MLKSLKLALSYVKKALLAPEPRRVRRSLWNDVLLQPTVFELLSTAQQLLARWRHGKVKVFYGDDPHVQKVRD